MKYPEEADYFKQSLSVVKPSEKVVYKTKRQGNELLIESKTLSVALNLKN